MTIGSILAAVAVLGTLAATLGAPIPKPAWQSDVERVERYAQDVDRQRILSEQQSLDLRLLGNVAEQQRYRGEGKPVPNTLIELEAALRARMRELDRRMDKLQ